MPSPVEAEKREVISGRGGQGGFCGAPDIWAGSWARWDLDRWTIRGRGGAVEREGIPGTEYSSGRGPGVGWDWGQGQLSTLSPSLLQSCVSSAQWLLAVQVTVLYWVSLGCWPHRVSHQNAWDQSVTTQIIQTPWQLQVDHACIHKLSVEDPARSPLTGLLSRS